MQPGVKDLTAKSGISIRIVFDILDDPCLSKF